MSEQQGLAKSVSVFTATGAWVLLVAATLVSAASSGLATAPGRAVGLVVLGAGFLKVLVILYAFMELHLAPRRLRALFLVWMTVVPGVLMWLYLFHVS